MLLCIQKNGALFYSQFVIYHDIKAKVYSYPSMCKLNVSIFILLASGISKMLIFFQFLSDVSVVKTNFQYLCIHAHVSFFFKNISQNTAVNNTEKDCKKGIFAQILFFMSFGFVEGVDVKFLLYFPFPFPFRKHKMQNNTLMPTVVSREIKKGKRQIIILLPRIFKHCWQHLHEIL